MLRTLVTGGAGYVGVKLVEALLDAGHHVTLLDNFMYGYDSVLHLIQRDRLNIVSCDIRNDLSEHVRGQDVVFHLAGISGYPACEANPSSAQFINVNATEQLVRSMDPGQCLVYASTTSFYGNASGVCDEKSPVRAVSLYGLTKHRAEEVVMTRDNSIALRFATIFGVSPRMRVDLLVNDFTYKAVNDRCIVLFEAGTKRTFLHIDDAIRGYLMTLDQPGAMKGRVFNVGTEHMNYTKLEVSEAIRERTGCTIINSELMDPDLRDFSICFGRIKELGYEPEKSLGDGIRDLVRLYGFYRPFATFNTI